MSRVRAPSGVFYGFRPSAMCRAGNGDVLWYRGIPSLKETIMEKVIGKFWAKTAAEVAARPKPAFVSGERETISVGICRVLEAKHGVKLARGVVRVFGPDTEQGRRDVDAAVQILIGLLDKGQYDGPERIEASRVLAGEHDMKLGRKRWDLFGIGS